MNAKRCDRCKKFFTDYKEFDGYVRLTIASKSPSRYQVKQDLCQECEQSLIEWFKGESDEQILKAYAAAEDVRKEIINET